MDRANWERVAAEWLDELGRITDEPPGLTRTFLSPALRRAKALVAGWMRGVGLDVHEDSAGNLIGRLDCGDPGAPTMACGSHLDTVRNAGRYDGALGVVCGLLAASALRGRALRGHLEVVAFSDEEGVRFQTTYLGSRFYAGTLGAAERAACDAGGISVDAAMAGHVPDFPAPPPRRLAGYVEAHIEQGPVLEAENLALGVVTAIAGQSRARIFVEGSAGHAGTTPMARRRDALTGAAEVIGLVEALARATPGLVATVGELQIPSAAGNVIPGAVDFSLDVRSGDDAARRRFEDDLLAEAGRRLAARGLGLRIAPRLDAPATACDPELTAALERVVRRHQPACPGLVSGAGHDAVALAEVTPVAMLFVRCRDGLSHHPDEYAAPADVAAAAEVLAEFLLERIFL
jgi:allantoate deiminase